ncbi:MAG: hypothetical protein K2X48_19655 [Chitinophagaceae bacterium]|nr:hypothetical protein [Chitinophagaceae bacterium]
MMKKIIKTILLPFFICLCSFASAQKKVQPEKIILQAKIRVIAKAYGDSVVLRWAPDKSWAWYKLNIIGYKIERIDLTEKDNPRKQWLTTDALKPYPLEKFKARFAPSNTNAAVAAQCLYGKNFETNIRQGQPGIVDRANVTDTRYAFALQASDYDGNVAVAAALRFTDKQVKKGGNYIYRIVPAALATQGVIDTGIVLIANNPATINAVPVITEAVAADRMGELHWNRNGADSWSGYYIERSEDGKNFTALNKIPFITSGPDSALLKEDSTKARVFAMLQTEHVFIDSLPQNYKNYSYRLRGMNAFAEISGYSNTVTIAGRDMTPPVAADMLNPQFISNRKIKVLWKKNSIEPDCKGYYITRAKTINGPYETLNKQLLPVTATEFTDENAYAHGGNFYMVVAVDTANNISSSVPAMGLVPDNTPPVAPTGLKGRIDKNGLVYLSWNRNSEEDIKGYKVYYANAANHVFTQVTTEPDSAVNFIDSITLRTLTKNIWYKIAAVDENNNHSEFSATIQLKKPDIVPPVPPVAEKVYVDTAGVQIDFINSPSDDAVAYIIYRKDAKNDWQVIEKRKHEPDKRGFHFTDAGTKPLVKYEYAAEAVDEDSLHSAKSFSVNAIIRTLPMQPAITTFTAEYDSKTKSVKLNWQYRQSGEYFFVIYRSVNGEPLAKYQSVLSTEQSFIDYTNTLKGATIQYAIQAIFKDERNQSILSKPATVIITETK